MKQACILALFIVVTFGAGAVSAESMHRQMHDGKTGDSVGTSMNEVSKAYVKSMDGMHEAMMTGIMASNPDEAFVRGMIPHHKGAVEMARIQLQYGKDPELRKLAQQIIDAQQEEIGYMQEWLLSHGMKK